MALYIPQEFINQLLERSDIVEIIQQRLPLKKRGANYTGLCPFHNEKTPSFSVSPQKQIYHCFGCGAGGSALNFIMNFEHLNFPEAVEVLAKELGMALPQNYQAHSQKASGSVDDKQIYHLMEKVCQFYQHQLKNHSQAKDYLKQRQINGAMVEKYAIGYALPQWRQLEGYCKQFIAQPRSLLIKAGMLIEKNASNQYERFRHRIMFPIRDRRGRIVGFGGRSLENEEPKYLNSPETVIFHKSQEVYGLTEARQAIREQQQVILVEGYMDVIALAQYGIENAVATLGTAMTAQHIRLLLRYSKELVCCFDGDEAGYQAAWRALENCLPFLHQGCHIRFMFLNQGVDPDTLVRTQGREAFLQQLKVAKSLTHFFIEHLTKQVDIATMDGKSRFCQLAKPLLQAMTDPFYVELMLQKIAQLLRFDPQRLRHLMQLETSTERPAQTNVPTKQGFSLSPMRLAITLLVQNPQLVEHTSDFAVSQSHLPGSQLLLELIEFIKECPHINTGMILEAFTGETKNTLEKLAKWPLMLPDSGVEDEFQDALKRIEKQSLEQQMDKLLTKAQTEGLTSVERQELQALIRKKHTRH
jgi:DNA primase